MKLSEIVDVNTFPPRRLERIKIFKSLYEEYDDFKDLETGVKCSIIRQTERSSYNEAIRKSIKSGFPRYWKDGGINDINKFAKLYSLICYRVQMNIDKDNKHNSELVSKIIQGEFDVKNIGSSSSIQLNPKYLVDIIEEINDRSQRHLQKKYSEQHECRRCHKRKTTEIEAQTRSLDEGSSLLITCEECGYKWVIGG